MDPAEILDELTIDDPETLKVLGDPLRLQILEQMLRANEAGELVTAKRLAERLDVPQTKLYYHLNLLEERGLIVVAETGLVSGIVEKRYRVRARRLRAEVGIHSMGIGGAADALEAVLAPLTSVLDRARRVTMETAQAKLEAADHALDDMDDELQILQTTLEMTSAQADAFSQKLEALVNQYRHGDGGGRQYFLTSIFVPVDRSQAKKGGD